MTDWLNLKRLVEQMLDADETPLIGAQDLAVWGGESTAERLEDFLQTWALPRSGMPWSLWQWTDRMEMQYEARSPNDLDYLERGRVFGQDGDLELRRDGDRFLWRFVGEAGTALPAGFDSTDYWDGRPDEWRLRPYERTALLWGEDEEGTGCWHEDRVGWAKLEYRGMEGNSVVQVRYIEYLHGGNVELVRLLRLEKGRDRPKGGNNA